MAQIVLGIIVLGVLAAVTWILYKRRKDERQDLDFYKKNTIDSLLRTIKIELAEAVRPDENIIATDINFEAVMRNKRRADKALTNCVYCIDTERDIVIAMIHDVLGRELPTLKMVHEVIDFENLQGLDPMKKFEILIYRLHRTYGKDVINYLEDEYEISQLHVVNDGYNNKKKRCFDYVTLDNIFAIETDKQPMTYSETLDILSILLYQKYKGLDCVDTLRSLNIDGMNIGTSGSIRYKIEGNYDEIYRVTNSVWVQIRTKWVHFSFLDFYEEGVMKRITNQLVSWGVSAPMTEKNPLKVNDMPDGSRVTAIRPPSGECWACFIRKFTLSTYSVEQLLNKPTVRNWELPAKLIYYLMKAEETTPFTGQMNTGKTSMMKAAVAFVENINIRVLELSFELAFKEIYKDKNTFTVKPTDYVSSAAIQDILKKTDGYLSMVGEVSDDKVAARMIQFCLIASAFTMFSHHGKDDNGLINGLTNSLVASGEYKDHNVAMSTVLDAIKHNVHHNFVNNERVIEYISEIIKEDEVTPYPEIAELMAQAKAALNSKDENLLAQVYMAYTMLTKEYYTRTTDRIRFSSRKILVFNKDTMTYETNDWYTEETFTRMLGKLNETDRAGFIQFYYDNWRNKEAA